MTSNERAKGLASARVRRGEYSMHCALAAIARRSPRMQVCEWQRLRAAGRAAALLDLTAPVAKLDLDEAARLESLLDLASTREAEERVALLARARIALRSAVEKWEKALPQLECGASPRASCKPSRAKALALGVAIGDAVAITKCLAAQRALPAACELPRQGLSTSPSPSPESLAEEERLLDELEEALAEARASQARMSPSSPVSSASSSSPVSSASSPSPVSSSSPGGALAATVALAALPESPTREPEADFILPEFKKNRERQRRRVARQLFELRGGTGEPPKALCEPLATVPEETAASRTNAGPDKENAEENAEERAAAAPRVSLIGRVEGLGAAGAGYLGAYDREPELINGRVAYAMTDDADKMLWFSDVGYWHAGPRANLGTSNSWLLVFDNSPFPERVAAEWQAGSADGEWQAAPNVHCLAGAGAGLMHECLHKDVMYNPSPPAERPSPCGVTDTLSPEPSTGPSAPPDEDDDQLAFTAATVKRVNSIGKELGLKGLGVAATVREAAAMLLIDAAGARTTRLLVDEIERVLGVKRSG